jgi:23S rRNA pseudouridine2605 synthase
MEAAIVEGKVVVNGQPAHIGQRINPASDTISLAGKPVLSSDAEKCYVALYKPRGTVSTTSDEQGRRTIISLLPTDLRTQRVFPVGRLDIDSEGLIIVTNDGALTQRLTHPSFHVPKTYHVLIDRRPTPKAVAHLARGVRLKEGMTAPADVLRISGERVEESWLSITIHEGRNRQVRRMLERVGYDTIRLIRVQIGGLHLDELDLEPGQHRSLSATEVALLESAQSQD